MAHQNFLAAASKAGQISRYYRLIGRNFCLQFAGSAMDELLTPALKHLEVERISGPCDLTICIWDNVSTETPPLALPWIQQEQKFRGEVEGYSSHQIPIVVDIHTKALHALNYAESTALYWIKDRKDLPWWVGGSPLQLILHWWTRVRGFQLTHAAAVGYPTGGVLLAGKSGSGKSTTALACMRAKMSYVGEDYSLLSDVPQVKAHSIYNSCKIGEKSLAWFPELAKHVVNKTRAKGDKAFLFHQQFQPEKILADCPLKAILTLKIASSSRLESIDPKEAIGPLSATTLWQLTHTGPVTFNHLKRVAEALPCYCLHLGSELQEAAELIGGLL